MPMTDLSMVVGIGYEKCGTSTLAATLTHDPRFASYPHKEAYYFNRGYNAPFATYMSKFETTKLTRFLVDVTPDYIRSRDALLRIKQSPIPAKVIICLRDPLRRAYSHYIHNIYFHHAHYDPAVRLYSESDLYERPYNLAFSEELERGTLVRSCYYDEVAFAYSLFGDLNTLVLILESDFEINAFRRKVSAFLGTDIDVTRIFPENFGATLPTIVCPADNLRLEGSAYDIELIKENAYIFLSEAHGIAYWRDVGAPARQAILDASYRWSCYVPAKMVEQLRQRYFDEDIKQIEQLLGRQLSEWKTDRPLLSRRWFGIGPLHEHKRNIPASQTILNIRNPFA